MRRVIKGHHYDLELPLLTGQELSQMCMYFIGVGATASKGTSEQHLYQTSRIHGAVSYGRKLQ